jgi:hypothetical protein
MNVTKFINFESYGNDFKVKVCEKTDIIKRTRIWSAGLFLKVTNMIIVSAYLTKISAFQKTTILWDDVSFKSAIKKEYFLLNYFRVSSLKF